REGAQHLHVLGAGVLERVSHPDWKEDDGARPQLADRLILDPEAAAAGQNVDRLLVWMGVKRGATDWDDAGELRHAAAADLRVDEHAETSLSHQRRRHATFIHPGGDPKSLR